mmetsp:Transcript_124260/g.337497  ORF Transcript_124260/g.337497 Transcript_124260/m.337497 type:complete len:351 (-) Transcript_124260:281-1333(-)
MPDYYEVLGVSRSCSESDLRQAYRRKALEAHPDKNSHRIRDATIDFQAIGCAYSVLKDPASRARYDHSLRSREVHQAAYGQAAHETGHFDLGQANDLFREVFGAEFVEAMAEVAQRIAPHAEAVAISAMGVMGHFMDRATPVVAGVMQDAQRRAVSEQENRVRLANDDLKRCAERVAWRKRSVEECEAELSKYDAVCKTGRRQLIEQTKSFLCAWLRNHVCISGIGCAIIFLLWQVRGWWIFWFLFIPLVPMQMLLVLDCVLFCPRWVFAFYELFKQFSRDRCNREVYRERVVNSRMSLIDSREAEERARDKVRRMQIELASCREAGPSLNNVVTAGLSFLAEAFAPRGL